jgi:RNA polymerase II subunit A-like phosphatase
VRTIQSDPCRSVPIADVEEACKHEVQFGNLCADCGKDMTTVTYNTVALDTARATVNAVHGHTSLLVSRAEASKSDDEAKRRLLSSRKLSLVVDLDQTIIQATVDPTVAEWQRDPQNPNYPAVKDVRAFQLIDDGPGARGCWYYIKLRPGLQEFLATISRYYELHIYTMGTRTYAQSIAKIVDPDRKIFADRILSRDESGSLTVKNLKRLFPVDTKMVVIIDDRGDVWHWCSNLVKVTPYDFFVGIGDINSSFLPKRPGLDSTPKPAATLDAPPSAPEVIPVANAQGESSANNLSALDQMVSMGGGNDPSKLKEQTSEQGEAIAAQLADRPLLQKQKILDAADEDSAVTPDVSPDSSAAPTPEVSPDAHNKYRHNLLQDNDTELHHLQQSLISVHSAFFEEFDRRASGPRDGRVSQLRAGTDQNLVTDNINSLPDVTVIMEAMKLKVLKGVHLVYSGVMPLGVQVQK